MGEIVNLRGAKKARVRASDQQLASENRARHGRTKAQREVEQAEADRLARHVEQRRLTRDDGQD